MHSGCFYFSSLYYCFTVKETGVCFWLLVSIKVSAPFRDNGETVLCHFV